MAARCFLAFPSSTIASAQGSEHALSVLDHGVKVPLHPGALPLHCFGLSGFVLARFVIFVVFVEQVVLSVDRELRVLHGEIA